MKLHDLSRAEGIGASSLWIELGPFRILIDAGLDPRGVGHEATPNYKATEFDSADLIVLTHCHLDHLGSLPLAAQRHPGAHIVCSKPSQVIAPRMLRNSVNVMKRQREEQGVKEYPLYGKSDIDQLEDRLRGVNLQKPFTLDKSGETLEVTLHRAGHIVGAVGVELVYKGRRIFHTGDVQFEGQRTLEGADFPRHRCDTLIMETTRGSTERPVETNRQTEVARLIADMADTLESGGSVLLPVFALGRMQEMISVLADAREQGLLPRVPTYCSGLGIALVDYFDTIDRKLGEVNFRRSELERLGVCEPPGEYKPGRDLGGRAIHLLSSGMMVEMTPAYMAATGILGKARNRVAFVGFCAPDTPGGLLQATAHGDVFNFAALDFSTHVAAQVNRYDLSGHADRQELIDLACDMQPRAVVLVHGDPSSREWFTEELGHQLPKTQVHNPRANTPFNV